jgi:1-acyl-sn-glycerol-3-phosphate acyltransferase
MGGVPVDRSKNTKLTDEIAKSFAGRNEMVMMVTPEGTRSYSPEWKKGFYIIAQKANVPILLGFLDYPKKEAGFGPVFYPTGDFDKDIEEIKNFYRTKKGRFPEKGVI